MTTNNIDEQDVKKAGIDSPLFLYMKDLFIAHWGKIIRALALTVCLIVAVVDISYTSHPLITDDAYTQGKGNFQLEVTGDYVNDKDTDKGATTNSATAATTIYLRDNRNHRYSCNNGLSKHKEEYRWNYFKNDGVVDAGIDVK
ncbi:MAG: hypothetical protein NT178_09635 [Proteobacteria bacterium]|nr:hypothetical protein [Pseudomonadota bacterium]